MDYRWSLDELYRGFDTPEYRQDVAALRGACAAFAEFAAAIGTLAPRDAVHDYLAQRIRIDTLAARLQTYAMLRQSADTGDHAARTQSGLLAQILSELSGADAAAQQYIAALPEPDAILSQDALAAEHAYLLRRIRRDAQHLLTPQAETLAAKLQISGSDAWEQLWESLTAGVRIPWNGGTETLSGIRGLAYSPDAAVRRCAYEAELAACDQIADAAAFSLNSIKLESIQLCRLRGYPSVLARTLEQSHMQQATLDALLTAVQEALPIFHRYLRAKGAALGHKNGLPWYDLFAPMGGDTRTYTPDEAMEILLQIFGAFDGRMRRMMETAFRNRWMDFFPRPGKVGGAFCQEIHPLRQSRILLNFGGADDGAPGDGSGTAPRVRRDSFAYLSTIAHELGHAYQNEMLFDHSILNLDLPMPLAETASTFNECVLLSAAITRAASPAEKLALLESRIADTCQIICDIYSRYLFEKSVFARRESSFLPASELRSMMLDAQRQAYGDGLDPDVLHRDMWICKGHYYSSELAFYNFPYAFGGLLARSLHAMYLAQGAAFVPRYQAFLRAATVMDAEDAAALCGADLTSPDFWRQGLASCESEVEEFLSLL